MCSRIPARLIGVAATLILCDAVFLPTPASAERWHDSFVFDGCSERTLVEVEFLGRKTTAPFVRQRHAVRVGTPVSLTIRYPKLFSKYPVLVEALEVPDALPHVRGAQLSSIDLGEQELPPTKGAKDIATIDIDRVTVESVVHGFLRRESARQLLLQIRSDRREIVDGARTVAADLRELYEAVEPVLGEGSGGPPYDRVPSLTSALVDLRRDLEVPKTDFCRLSHTEKSRLVADAPKRQQIRGWIESTDRLVENHRRIGLRWQGLGVDGLLDRIIRDAEDLDTVMNGFVDNLHAHEAALDLLDELVKENRGPHLSWTTLRDRWVLDFAKALQGEYSTIRTAEELRAIAERFQGEFAAKEHSHIEWLVEFGRELRETIEGSAATVGAPGREVCRECGAGEAVTIIRNASERLEKEIDLASRLGCCARGAPDLRHAVRTAVARVMDARSAIDRELSRLNEKAAKLFKGINTILTHSRGSDKERSLGVYDRNTVVTFRVFEQTPHEPYAVVPAVEPELFSLPQGGGVRSDEAGATADTAGEGVRFVGEGMFEVHRTYHLAAFGALTWTFRVENEKHRRHGEGKRASNGSPGSNPELSYVAGLKVYFRERDLFPGAPRQWEPALVLGLPVNRMPGFLIGGSWSPYNGIELMGGWHSDWGTAATNTTPGESGDDTQSHEPRPMGYFLGVSLDPNIFSSLFGAVAKVGGAF